MAKNVYLFNEGNKDMKDLLGGKGANLAEMTRIGLPVPPGLTISTETCIEYLKAGETLTEDVKSQVQTAIKAIEADVGKVFGDKENPLLFSCRSGAKFSMPGMMDTILNIGLNDETIQGVINKTQDKRFAYDSYRRLVSMFGDVVFGIDKDLFEHKIDALKQQKGYQQDTDLTGDDWEQLTNDFKALFKQEAGQDFPQNPYDQLWYAVEAVFKSWNIPRAIKYRTHHGIRHDLGTAVNIQTMVFGNMGDTSATGVAFTRNPASGDAGLYGEYLVNAQGEDVVAGIRTPERISVMEQKIPELYKEFLGYAEKLEKHYKDMQDIEFTIEEGRLFILQTRNGKRTAKAAVKIAVDLVSEGILTKDEALLQVDANQLPQLLLPSFNLEDKENAVNQKRKLATGLSASPGAAVGKVVFNPDEAEERNNQGEKVILVRIETVPDDIHGMIAAQGILTTRGGNTSHAAVVARGMGKPCVAGCGEGTVDMKNETFTVRDTVVKKGDVISIDGSTGEVFLGAIMTEEPKIKGEFEDLMSWADGHRTLGVRANADTPEDALKAKELGAKGIGLCRTEHMFMGHDRLPRMQEMILSETEEERRAALDKLLPMQHQDFKGIFRAMEGFPVTIRLLDPPLHEFLPSELELIEENVTLQEGSPKLEKNTKLLRKIRTLQESNPMLGFRGCRLGLVYPEIGEMQVRAIFEAACDVQQEGREVFPEVMIPLVGHPEELKRLKDQLESIAKKVMEEKGVEVNYLFGTMIEVPRAALVADEIAQHAQFFSFGTNDLTQMTFGYSRDDAESKFLSVYLEKGILLANPFEELDQEGVGQLVQMAKDKAQQTRKDIKVGICGEHGGEASSVEFCHRVGLHYVSCSPFRVPVSRLAGAQAVIKEKASERSLKDTVSV